MKKILAFTILVMITVSCYDDYVRDFDFNSVYFPFQTNVRTFVVGEGMQIQVGVSLSGVMENKIERVVEFEVNNALVTPSILSLMKGSGFQYIKDAVKSVNTLLPLPDNYYTLSDNTKMIIKPGQHMGAVILKADSANFLADAATKEANYAIPFYIRTADADSIHRDKRFTVIGLRYENMLFGTYWHGGSAIVKRPGLTDTVLNYYTTIPQPDAKTWTLKTVAPDALVANGFTNTTTAKDEMKLTLSGNNITVSSVAGSTVTVLPDGASVFNRSRLLQDRKIFLKYSYTGSNGYTYNATDTLTFRNRIRDGVNEWQDENQSHYSK